MGLTSEWVSIHIEEPHKRILGVPDLLKLYLIIPIGYPDVPAREGVRRPLEDIVHRERYDMSKYMSNEDVFKYLYSLREGDGPRLFGVASRDGRREKIEWPRASVNPITVEVVRNGLAHIANEMATVLRKTSYNMMIYEVRDYCVGIVDPEGNILSQNFGALPIFLADLGPGDRRRRAHARP